METTCLSFSQRRRRRDLIRCTFASPTQWDHHHVRFVNLKLRETRQLELSSALQGWRYQQVNASLSPLAFSLSTRSLKTPGRARNNSSKRGQEKKLKPQELGCLNHSLCYLNGKPMFALSKGNKGKWVSGIEKHCRIFHNLASLDEHAQKLCHRVYTVGRCIHGMRF